ncbi:MAG TPA: lipopolysaccharide heptosyltransferase I [Thermosulfurimonas dismutans]|uniref:Lipopolysaccharide heptosyltransferase 1 n=1 Tax=Thermosulfurimonas dismutans TaxID=999894 RepID=A0A7C3CTH9_9BACT|nr:lipopolysaccharide heptosyltransferase I [Thermosulfurimonas dismutans]
MSLNPSLKRILIVKLSALGDVVQALPVLAALKRGHPGLEIDWVAERPQAELLEDHPLIRRLIVFPRREILALFKRGRPGAAVKLFREFLSRLRAERYDAVLDLQGLFKSGVVVAFSRSSRKLGFTNHREGSTLPLTEKLPPYDPDLHAVRRYLLAAEALGGVSEPVEFPLPRYPSAGEVAQRLALPPPPWLIFIPATRWRTKLWPVKNWRELSEAVRELSLPLLWVGGPGDRGYVEGCAACGENLCGRLTLKELCGVLSGARAVVSVDTGPMHLAAALGRRVVALFGPTAPWRTGPFGEGHRVLRAGLPCSPCFRKKCRDPRCMEALTPEEVLSALAEILG